MSSRRAVTAILVATAASVANPMPAAAATVEPVESLAAFVARFQAAVAAIQAGDCARFNQLNLNQGLSTFVCTERQRRALDNFQLISHQQFGPGAVIDYRARDFKTLRPAVATAELLIGSDRRFQIAGTPIFGTEEGEGIRQVKTKPAARVVQLSQRTADLALRSLRERDCDLFFQTWYTGGLTRSQACDRVFAAESSPSNVRRLRIEVARDKTARAKRIGGTRDIQFYGLTLETERYFTLLVDRSGPPGRLYLTVTRFVR